jgi:hypothetical protein
MRGAVFALGVALCVAGCVQSNYPAAMDLYVPGIALILAAMYYRRDRETRRPR